MTQSLNQQQQGSLAAMPPIPQQGVSGNASAPAHAGRYHQAPSVVNLQVPSIVNIASGPGGVAGGAGGGSSSSSSSSNSSSFSLIPSIPAFHNLGAGRQIVHSSNQSTSSVDARAHDKYSKKFSLPIPIPIEQLDEEVEVIVPKALRGLKGSKEYLMYQKLATASIDNKFGVPSYLLTDRSGAEDGDQTKHLFIQQQYVDNLSKVEAIKQRIMEYDMTEVAMVPVGIRNGDATDVADIFEFDEKNIMDGWSTISWETALTYQFLVNSTMPEEDRDSSKWLKVLLFESCTTEMREVVMLEYNIIENCFHGGITFAWILCNKLFGLNRDTVASLVNFLRLFRNKGLRRYQGENVALARKELLAVCSRLCEAKQLPQETPIDILTGLTLCSVDQFKTLFEHKLQQSKVDSLQGNIHFSQDEIMGQSRAILSQAQQYYNSLNMSDIWSQTKTPRVNVFGTPGELKCWNCGKAGHGLDKCSEPRNESRIAENRQKWEASGGRSKSRKKGSGNSSGGGGATYERTKWAPPKPGESGVRYFDGSHHAYCKKKHNGVVCGWNTSHSTSFHKKWSELGTAFSLAQECPTHELVLKSGSGSHSSSSTRAASSSVSSSGGAATANSFVLPEAMRNAISQLNDSVRTPSEQLLMDGVLRSLRLN